MNEEKVTFNESNIRAIFGTTQPYGSIYDRLVEVAYPYDVHISLPYDLLTEYMAVLARFLSTRQYMNLLRITLTDVLPTPVIDLSLLLLRGKIYNRNLEIESVGEHPFRVDACCASKISQYKDISLKNAVIEGDVFGCDPQKESLAKAQKWKYITFVNVSCMRSIVNSINAITRLSNHSWQVWFELSNGSDFRDVPRDLDKRIFNVYRIGIKTNTILIVDDDVSKVVQMFAVSCPSIRHCTLSIRTTELFRYCGSITSQLRKMGSLKTLHLFFRDVGAEGRVAIDAFDDIFRLPMKKFEFGFYMDTDESFYKSFFECLAIKKAVLTDAKITTDMVGHMQVESRYEFMVNFVCLHNRTFIRYHKETINEIWAKYCVLTPVNGKENAVKMVALTMMLPAAVVEHFVERHFKKNTMAKSTHSMPLRKKKKIQ